MKKVKWYSLPPLPTLLLVGAAAALLTCTLRALLVNYVRKNEMRHDLQAEYRRYRLVGILLVGFNVVISGILSRMIGHNEAYDYPGVRI